MDKWQLILNVLINVTCVIAIANYKSKPTME